MPVEDLKRGCLEVDVFDDVVIAIINAVEQNEAVGIQIDVGLCDTALIYPGIGAHPLGGHLNQ